MSEIVFQSQVSESPECRCVQQFLLALARVDRGGLEAMMTRDVSWHPAGRLPVAGREACLKAITRYGPPSSVVVDQLIADQGGASVNGVVAFDARRRSFCHVLEFSREGGLKIRRITSYSVPLS